MNHYIDYNMNKYGIDVGDCVVRALSIALAQSWDETFDDLAAKAKKMANMPSANAVWGAYLRDRGFIRRAIPTYLPEDYNVKDFCIDHPSGVYILALDGHVVPVIDGEYIDSWRSGMEIPQYYWYKDRGRR